MAVNLKKGRALTNLSLTPLIDVVFLLLIFFLVATRFAEEDRELDVTLPSASEAKPMIVEPKEIFININRDGGYFVDGKKVTLEELDRLLKAAVDNNPLTQSVIIRADKHVQFDYPVRVMNLCNRHGILDYKIQTAANP